MNKITELMDSLDFSKLVPELSELMDRSRSIAGWAVMIGPVLLLILGLIYYFIPPKEANHKFGFRTYFGMGSVEAWRYTQRLAGIVLGALGIVLTVVMGIFCLTFFGKETPQLLSSAMWCLIFEVVLTFAAWLAVNICVTVRYDTEGNLRKKK